MSLSQRKRTRINSVAVVAIMGFAFAVCGTAQSQTDERREHPRRADYWCADPTICCGQSFASFSSAGQRYHKSNTARPGGSVAIYRCSAASTARSFHGDAGSGAIDAGCQVACE